MEILIRRACPEDNEHIVAHITLAMEDIIFRFIGEESSEKAFAFLSSLVKSEATCIPMKTAGLPSMEAKLCAWKVW